MDALASTGVFQFDNFRLDQRSGGLFRENGSNAFVPVSVGSRALALLVVLVERAGELVSKQELLDAVWPGTAIEESNLSVQLGALRRIIDTNRSAGSCIQTVAGRGYRFLPEVRPARLRFTLAST